MTKKNLSYKDTSSSTAPPFAAAASLGETDYQETNPQNDKSLKTVLADPDMGIEKQYEIFLRGIIHDVNNNLMAITSACDQLDFRGDEVNPEEITSTIRAHIKSVASLMRDLLDNQNMDTPVRMDEDELKSFLKGILPSLSLVAGLNTRVELGDFTISPVMVNPMLLHRVLLQLVRNVSELDVDHPLAFITARRHENWCEISVSDNGPGLDGISIQKLFESGYTTKAKQGTRGYGLSAVAWAVSTWNGTYGVDCIEGDTGCRFWVRLPLSET